MVQVTIAGAGRGSFTTAPYEPGGALVHVPRQPVPSASQIPQFVDPPPPIRPNLSVVEPTAPTPPPPPTPPGQPLPNLANLTRTPVAATAATGGALEVVGTTAGVEGAIGTVAATGAIATTALGVLAIGLTVHNLQTLHHIWRLSQPEPKFEPKPEYKDIGHAGETYIVRVQYESYEGVGTPPAGYIEIELEAPVGSFINQTQVIDLQGNPEGIAIEHGSPTKRYVTSNTGRVERNKPFIASVTKTNADPIQTIDATPPQQQRQTMPQRQYLPEFAEPQRPTRLGLNLAPMPQIQHDLEQAVRTNQQRQNVPYTINQPANIPATITNSQGQTINLPAQNTPTKIQISSSPPGTTITQTSGTTTIATFTSPGTSPVTISAPGQTPITIDPTGKTQPTGAIQDLSSPSSKTFTPQPATAPSIPITPTSPTTPTTETKQPTLQDVIEKFAPLAALTPIIQQIANNTGTIKKNTTEEAITTAAAAGTCRTTQPGGCTSNLVNGAADNINKNTDKKTGDLSNLLNGYDAALDTDTNLRVRNIEDKTGSNEYPMVLPEYMMEDSLDKQITITNQAQFNAWLLKNLSALFGMFPIKIEKENEDGTKQIIKFDNLAETLAEFVGIYSKIAFDADTAVNVGVRAVAEGIGARTAALQAGSYLKAIIDYLGFQTQHESFPVKISCTIGAVGVDGNLQESELDDFLKPSTQNIIGIECKEQSDLQSIIKRILFDTEVARAALYKPLKPSKTSNDLTITGDGIKAHRKKEEEKINKKWEEFKTKTEGQTNLPFKVDIDEKGNNTTT